MLKCLPRDEMWNFSDRRSRNVDKSKRQADVIPGSDTLCQRKQSLQAARINLMLLQYPDGADCPLRVNTELKKKSEEWLHGGGCGCVCMGKRKSDHVTSLIHPLGLYVCSGTKEWPLRISSAFLVLFFTTALQLSCNIPARTGSSATLFLWYCLIPCGILNIPQGACYSVATVLGEDLKPFFDLFSSLSVSV